MYCQYCLTLSLDLVTMFLEASENMISIFPFSVFHLDRSAFNIGCRYAKD